MLRRKWYSHLQTKFKRETILSLTALITLFIFTTFFQNCSNEIKFKKSVSDSSGVNPKSAPSGQLKINNGNLFTNNQTVSLHIDTVNAHKMHLNNGSDCQSNDEFIDIQSTLSWLLEDFDGKSTVSLILKNNLGEISDCITAQIVLDRKSPSIKFEEIPDKFSMLKNVEFSFSAFDESSGVKNIKCQSDSNNEYLDCSTHKLFENLTEGYHNIKAFSEDHAGNKSEIIEYHWYLDLSPPTVLILSPLNNEALFVNGVSIKFEGSDGQGSGIQFFKCSLDGQSIEACSSPLLLTQLSDTKHTFTLQAIDHVGWSSNITSVDFTIDTQPSGDFQILGVTGGEDKLPDGYLSSLSAPELNWSTSLNAQTYSLQILDSKDNKICGPVSIDAPINKGSLESTCKLNDGMIYKSIITAFKNNYEKQAPPFSFLVDVSGPKITISDIKVNDELKSAHIEFSISDTGSGINISTCYKKFSTDSISYDCKDKTSLDFQNLSEGEHIFWIQAVDKVGNLTQSIEYKFNIKSIVCDPFHQVEGPCKKGVKSSLYYASSADRDMGNSYLQNKFTSVDKMITDGLKSNTIIYLPNIDVKTRHFTDGFSTTTNSVLTDDEGIKLDEWFALDMYSIIKLNDSDAEGYYQLIVLSDDGSILEIDRNHSGIYSILINNDGQHPTRVGCSAVGDVLNMTKTSRIPIHLKYYQGPRTQIGMMVLWRKINTINSPNSAYCGKQGSDGWGFGTEANYQLLYKEGFKALTETNYILDEK